ncbi:tryptophan synthase [Geopyxis carbonaria]|nr:tryptophan synthase [Geopyxis carbonaria]
MATKLPFPYLESVPDENGYFGAFGGSFLPPPLQAQMDALTEAYKRLRTDPEWISELAALRRNYQGRPTPLQYAARLTAHAGGTPSNGVQIWLKREDLNHTGAHKLNHTMAEALLAKALNKTKLIAETGAGQHGVALATAAAHFGLQCDIYMGAVDIAKEAPNVARMRILGATVVPVTAGRATLKDAVDAAFAAYISETAHALYCIGSVVGPHPFPWMVREFQRVVSAEAKSQFAAQHGGAPSHIVACCGGGSNAMGIFADFIDDPAVRLHAVEPLGRSAAPGDHAASLARGAPGTMHGFASIMLHDPHPPPRAPDAPPGAAPAPVHSVASGLDYPSVGPEHAFLYAAGRTERGAGATDEEAVRAFFALSRLEGVIPALETAHAVAYAVKLARKAVEEGRAESILVNVSGRGDKDVDFVLQEWGHLADEEVNI